MRERICIVGAGGFGRETLCCALDSARHFQMQTDFAFMVDDEHFRDHEIMGVPVLRRSEWNPDGWQVVVAIGDPSARRKVAESLPLETVYGKVIHPTAVISDWVELSPGTIITAGVVLTCNVQIGKHAHLNLNSTVGHDCVITDYFTAAPSANVSGKCTIGDGVYLGTGAGVREGVTIVGGVTVGMGGMVLNDITEPGVYAGVPARRIK
jgi:sugar O-acyltransferase (sialic acid O-acetyltransferase NeuD family)